MKTVSALVRDAGGVAEGSADGQVDLVAAARGVEALSCLATHAKVKNQLSQDAATVKALANISAELEAVVRRRPVVCCALAVRSTLLLSKA